MEPSEGNNCMDIRKPVFGVSDQVQHKPDYTITSEDGYRLGSLVLGRRGIYVAKTNVPISCAADLPLCFCLYKNRFSHEAAHTCLDIRKPVFGTSHLIFLGPVVQSIVSLMTSLRCQLVKYMLTTLSNTLVFFVGKI